MNRRNPTFRFALIVAAVAILLTTRTSQAAGGRTTTRKTGVIVSVDQAKHSFVIHPDGETKDVVAEWQTKSAFFGGSKTEFFEGASPADAAILKKGIHVQVRYHEALWMPNRAALVRSPKPTSQTR